MSSSERRPPKAGMAFLPLVTWVTTAFSLKPPVRNCHAKKGQALIGSVGLLALLLESNRGLIVIGAGNSARQQILARSTWP
jgi:hypothetical protein